MPSPTKLGIIRLIKQAVDEMPAISPVFNKLTEMSRNLETDANELVKLIMLDPVLSAKVLKLINSAFYGMSQPVNSLTEAVIMLGVNTVKNLATCTAVLDRIVVGGRGMALNPQEFWVHCLGTAVACRLLGKAQNVPDDELETHFLAGLLHDLGKVILLKAIPGDYEIAMSRSAATSTSLNLAEMECFGFDHAQVGRLLANRWKLTPSLVDAIENHHLPDTGARPPLTQRVIAANNLCKKLPLGQSGNTVIEPSAAAVAESLQIQPQILQDITLRMPQELDKAMKFLKIQKKPASQ
ncbi:MAG: HDOD domain-containing protein [Verrucomicrobiae bacterium]|nr:HDOD domain-containing protein [Verrucomicrobiae bacterium]